jgi:hypothetical protein
MRQDRLADSRLVHRVTRVQYARRTPDVTTPDGCWDLVMIRRARGRPIVVHTGLITRPFPLDFDEGDEYVAISFKPGVYMTQRPGVQMLDRGVVQPVTTKRTFRLDGDAFEIPTFENAEGLVDRLSRRGLLARDAIVERVLDGDDRAASPRTVQRHFLHALGVTSKHLELIYRAQSAVALLECGRAPTDVALSVGYADQAHMTRWVKRITGRTPGVIARA